MTPNVHHELLFNADNYIMLPLKGGGQVLVASVDNSTTAVLAWRAADNATAAMTASSVSMSATPFLNSTFANATVNNATLDPFEQALQGLPNSNQDLAEVTVFCTLHSVVNCCPAQQTAGLYLLVCMGTPIQTKREGTHLACNLNRRQ